MCETLLFDDPIDYGSKIIDLLWRKVAYDPIQIFKRYRPDDNDSTMNDIRNQYRMHLLSIFAFYSTLLIKFVTLLKPYRNLTDFLEQKYSTFQLV